MKSALRMSFLVLFIVVLLLSVGCSSQPSDTANLSSEPSESESAAASEAPPVTDPPESTEDTSAEIESALCEPVVYPLSIKEQYMHEATSAPDIIFSTTGEENGLPGAIYWLDGTVTEISSLEMEDGIPADYFILRTDRGDVWCCDLYTYGIDSTGDLSYLIDESGADYSFPNVGDYVRVYCIYTGYTRLLDMPAVIYGVPEAYLYNYRSSDDSPLDSEDVSSSSDVEITTGMRNALSTAKSYLKYTSFSYSGLIDQLEYEGYSSEEAVYGVDNCGADWNEQALESANSYLKYSSFSYSGLIDQLEYEGFTTAEATYGVDNCGADWFEQAAKSAASYLKYSSFSRSSLISQLEFEGFTHEQAVYGAEQNGY